MTKKYNNKKHINEMISLIMYTRNIDKKQNTKKSIGIIDKQQEQYEQQLKTKSQAIT